MAEEGEVHEPSDFELKVEKTKPARFIAKKAQLWGLYISAARGDGEKEDSAGSGHGADRHAERFEQEEAGE